ncbi:MAG TPA: LLM class oxidoreductase [Bacillota bacterium]|nr:LLM class oxidoreductase [Bacillota bacterium]
MNPFANHRGYTRTFQDNRLTLSLVYPLESYAGNIPKMDWTQQISLAQTAEKARFAALFVRDIPLNDPSFGDAGQMYDPWIFLSHIAAYTQTIALGTASAITSFQHPINLAKSAASMDKISGERLLFGLATGDRPVEFAAYGVEREKRAELYQEALHVMRKVWSTAYPSIQTARVHLTGDTDVLPKPALGNIPVLVTGFSGQNLEWIAQNGDGWMSYFRHPDLQEIYIRDYRSLTNGFKPFVQSLHIDLAEDADEEPTFIHGGFRSGRRFLVAFLNKLQEIGVNHVIINTKYSQRPAADVIHELAEEVVPHFPAL